MKRALAFSTIFLFGSLAAWAQPAQSSSAASRRFENPLLNDVVLMTQADLSEATIIAYVRARRFRLASDVSADDLIGLQQAGVKESVVRYIAGSAGIEAPAGDRRSQELNYDSRRDRAVAVQPPYGEDETYYDSYGYGGYPYGYGYGYGYPYGYGSYPYWYAYSPYYISGGHGFGRPGFFRGGGHFRGGGRFGGGGHFGGGGRFGGGGHGGGGHGGGGHR